ncbi:hypothetical protein K469DRAFT_598039 [Zopfia rhizophila CBS 207.26]|uniref:Uncharacterized protein n=1 Tax=Zopfia rhizophila CBS 207.26 TaxID=1314779 RepID=A0A6A6DH80_9PEZI|nr:hypothetical protein K469DRAFT_598039 [Zopfia rhizophila CBS 207.26]
MERTPSPPARINTPPTPLHGARYDNWEPYSPRRSSRVAAQRNYPLQLPSATDDSFRKSLPSSRKYSAARTSGHALSPPSSPISAHKQRSPRSTRNKNFDVGAVDSDSDNVAPTPAKRHLSAMDPRTMLPTPAKTPRKRALQSQEALNSTARVLFPARTATVDEAMPTPRKGRKSRKNVFTLESFAEQMDEDAEKIEIYTDSKERIPTLDETEENPFMMKKGKGKANGTRQAKSRKLDPKEEEMHAAVARGEGMLMKFRGRTMLRKFHDGPLSNASSDPPDFSGDELSRRAGAEAQRPFTRSSIQPRLLFPNAEQRQERELRPDDVDEEAVTDIEYPIPIASLNPKMPSLIAPKAPRVVTPVKPTFSPATPPSARRPKRGKKEEVMEIDDEAEMLHATAEEEEVETPPVVKTRRGKKNSPFDSWPRVKSTGSHGTKREGEVLEKAPSKRTRSGAVAGPSIDA